MNAAALPAFEIVARQRPVAIVGTPVVEQRYDGPPAPHDASAPSPALAPFTAVEVGLGRAWADVVVHLDHADGWGLTAALEDGRVRLDVGRGAARTSHRSRRHGRATTPPDRVALALTGTQVTALSHEAGRWIARARVDLADVADSPEPRDPAWLSGLTAGWACPEQGVVTDWCAGAFGQLGLRDIRLASHADGSPYRMGDGSVLLTATSAGPGFFGTAHTSVWRLPAGADGQLTHLSDLFFRHLGSAHVRGDHATHLVRDDGRWLVATSTWSDFPTDPKRRDDARVTVTLAETDADLIRGQHVLTTRPLDLPTDGASVGVWDPHLVRRPEGGWMAGYVSARRFFDFHPVLAEGPALDRLSLRAARTDRRATEGTTIVRVGDDWRVLASDGRANRRSTRARFPVLDLDLDEVGALAAPYPTNLPWPTVIPPDPARPGDRWRMVTFNGAAAAGPLAGYGTHGEVVLMCEVD